MVDIKQELEAYKKDLLDCQKLAAYYPNDRANSKIQLYEKAINDLKRKIEDPNYPLGLEVVELRQWYADDSICESTNHDFDQKNSKPRIDETYSLIEQILLELDQLYKNQLNSKNQDLYKQYNIDVNISLKISKIAVMR
ncbi:hypothetical protein [Sporomusa sp.]|uniref:hypothetical protein n=1 Tax=Sporomusa sp. TaxID=2078658 RepID=UPI002D7EC5BC|nr:hypothetical protein [Sporomusa sp.]